MLSSRWTKVLNDLWQNKMRTVLIILSIAVGLFAIGTIISARTILSTEMDKSFAAINPSSGTVRTVELFDEAFVRSVRGTKNVADADARRVIEARVQVDDDEWANLTIFAIADYDTMRVNKIWPEEGAWPPPEREILIERAALPVIGAEIGDTLLIETSDEKQRILRIAGTAHDLSQLPAQFDNSPYGYISFETLAWFGAPHGLNELHVVAENPDDKDFAQSVMTKVKNKAERSGMTIPMSLTAEPGQIPLDDFLQAILIILGALGLLALFLSTFLIINTVSALLAQQKRQIGVMKAIGARSGQLIGMYMAMVVGYGLLALIIAVPLSVVGARILSRFIAGLFNFDLTSAPIPPAAIVIQGLIGLLIPVLASLVPFLVNLRVTAAEAMNAHTMGKGKFGVGPLDRLLSGKKTGPMRAAPIRPLLLSLRNTFRSKGRLLLTVITLTLASAIFVSVFSVRTSLFNTVDDILRIWNFDLWITFSRPYRVEEIEQEAHNVQGVNDADIWIQIPTRLVRSDGSESGTMFLFAPPANSELAPSPKIVRGRSLLPEDENAIVVSTILLQQEPDIDVGDEIVLKIRGRETSWRVVGVSVGFIFPMSYANYPYVASITGRTGRADAALIATETDDEVAVGKALTAVEDHFERRGLRVSNTQTVAAERAEANVAYGIIITLLLIMAVLLAIVGGLGLMGTMSINVLERTREIGVLRAIGAPNKGVARVFIREGIFIGLMSWLFGSILALPLSKLLSNAVGIPLSGAPLSYEFSTTGMWLWLFIVIGLSALASFLPARNASRLTVREVLAYE